MKRLLWLIVVLCLLPNALPAATDHAGTTVGDKAIACPPNRSIVQIPFDPWGACRQQAERQAAESKQVKRQAAELKPVTPMEKLLLEKLAVKPNALPAATDRARTTVSDKAIACPLNGVVRPFDSSWYACRQQAKRQAGELRQAERRAFLENLAVKRLVNKKTPASPVCPNGLYYQHHDWELACDNTCTCRAAGYQSDDSDGLPVSLLLTRKAGPNESVTGELMIDRYGESPVDDLPFTFEASLHVNDRMIGKVVIRHYSVSDLGVNEISALLKALLRDSKIELIAEGLTWRLSDKGAAAVLLKMDEYQGRIGTPGALVRKGKRNEHTVFAPLPAPVVIVAPFHKPMPGDDRFAIENSEALREALRTTISDENCWEFGKWKFSSVRLTETRMRVSTLCAYGLAIGHWVVNASPPYDPILITTDATDYGGTIHKIWGLMPCQSRDNWTWDGTHYIHTRSSSSGMCKLTTPGGAWSLPTIVTDVRTVK
jgi:hypothetical protein